MSTNATITTGNTSVVVSGTNPFASGDYGQIDPDGSGGTTVSINTGMGFVNRPFDGTQFTDSGSGRVFTLSILTTCELFGS